MYFLQISLDLSTGCFTPRSYALVLNTNLSVMMNYQIVRVVATDMERSVFSYMFGSVKWFI